MARTRYTTAGETLPLRRLPAAALRAVLKEGYGAAEFKADVLAGLVVGVVALPLAMALAVAVGLPPQHGLYTAIIAGAAVALLGGSRTQISGPTAAFVVVLAPIYQQFGLSGLLISGLIGGLVQVGMGLARLGRLIQFIPHPVTTGFTAGIATVIATLQLKDLLGLQVTGNAGHYLERVAALFQARGTASLQELLISVVTLGLLLLVPRFLRRVPAPLVALPVAALLAAALSHFVPDFRVATIASRFHTTIDGVSIAGIPRLLPSPVIPWLIGDASSPSFDQFRALLSGGLVIGMLGAIESLLSAVVADGMARTKHDPDAELLALGVGNLLVPFFGGIAATGAIARTATNIKAGGRSPFAAVIHALTILAAMLLLAPLLGYLPMASLAALLVLVAWNMSDARHFLHTVRVAPRSDVMVLLTCYTLTVGVDMVMGVAVGMVLAAFLFMGRMAELTQSQVLTQERTQVFAEPVPAGVAVYEISGPLFFGAAQKAMEAIHIVGSDTKAVILLMDDVSTMDITGLIALESALTTLRQRGCLAVLCGVRPGPLALLAKAHLLEQGGVSFCATTEEALLAATEHASHTLRPPAVG